MNKVKKALLENDIINFDSIKYDDLKINLKKSILMHEKITEKINTLATSPDSEELKELLIKENQVVESRRNILIEIIETLINAKIRTYSECKYNEDEYSVFILKREIELKDEFNTIDRYLNILLEKKILIEVEVSVYSGVLKEKYDKMIHNVNIKRKESIKNTKENNDPLIESLELLLGISIISYNSLIIDEKDRVEIVYKTELELKDEYKNLFIKLKELFTENVIDNDKYETYKKLLKRKYNFMMQDVKSKNVLINIENIRIEDETSEDIEVT